MDTREFLACRDLTIAREGRLLWQNLTLCLKETDVLVITGANGSGKTTLLKTLAGLWTPLSGVIKKYVSFSYVGHQDGLYQQERVVSYLKASTRAKNIERMLSTWQLEDQPINELSVGQKRRVALARVTLSQKPLWILDEPTRNLDESGIKIFWQAIDQHQSQGGAALLATHGDVPKGNYQRLEAHGN